MTRFLTPILVVVVVACGQQESQNEGAGSEAEGPANSAASAPTILADGGSGLVFTWIDENGEHHVSTAPSEIPEKRRAIVRVQDPSRPPTAPGEVWVADLREAEGGRFPVKKMKRLQFEKLAQPRQPPPPSPVKLNTPPGPAAESGEAPRVVMYSTSTCPVCRTARRWLSKQGVSFVERNLERDQLAAAQLQEKARQQGVSANGVPIFEIGGKLIPGFNKQALSQALGR